VRLLMIAAMATGEHNLSRGRRRARRILADLASELRHARIEAGISQAEVGRRLGWSADKVWTFEHERSPSLSIRDACEMGALLGFDVAVRAYPNGARLRDAGQAGRLLRLLGNVGAPLRHATDVPLPRRDDGTELRAWDAVISGSGERTSIELESRLMDLQATMRRHNLKRRDDPVDHFLLVIADTKHNRRVVAEFADLLAELPRLRTANVLAALRAGRHPPTGFILL
jgi:transcriptional regulator with XRE-family HTH domain